ncbi:uncharacterized protein SPSK_05703 [Sporothrix schenckii 1099-18]|uniref:Uncharacterized protein n=1 Tax=Sporothrix schenckii 1099-18 TaxID=1397361 RepID=A0A0F2LVR2_SPOSC|nr:uncharacterized protein SPSK_05703 [Sporothrix schenckii 1099-18]KJR80585.1 hypothetical protein SPSK_05703 [Sporothrix schenckii 1099-18]
MSPSTTAANTTMDPGTSLLSPGTVHAYDCLDVCLFLMYDILITPYFVSVETVFMASWMIWGSTSCHSGKDDPKQAGKGEHHRRHMDTSRAPNRCNAPLRIFGDLIRARRVP